MLPLLVIAFYFDFVIAIAQFYIILFVSDCGMFSLYIHWISLKTITKTVISNQKSSLSGKFFGVNRKFNETNFDIVQYYGSMANASNTGNIINLFSLCFMRKTKQWFKKFTWKIIVNDTVLKQVGNKYFYIERK